MRYVIRFAIADCDETPLTVTEAAMIVSEIMARTLGGQVEESSHRIEEWPEKGDL